MKLTEARIKEIILEELNKMNEQDKQQPQEEDEAKTLAELRKFMLEKSKQVANLKGASVIEVKQLAAMIDLMLSIIPKGEVGRYLDFAQDKLKDKVGIK
jgi:hypothetical protein